MTVGCHTPAKELISQRMSPESVPTHQFLPLLAAYYPCTNNQGCGLYRVPKAR